MKTFKFLRINNLLSPECYLPEYYDTTNTYFSYVTDRHWAPNDQGEYRFMIFKGKHINVEISRIKIRPTHPMYNFMEVRNI